MENNKFETILIDAFVRHASSIPELYENGIVFARLDRVEATGVAPNSYKIVLDGACVSVEIILYPLAEQSGVVLVYLIRSCSGERLNLKDWLVMHGRLKDKGAFRLAMYGASADDQMRGFCKFLRDVFGADEAKALLTGLAWESIPFDWTGIR